MENKNMLAEFQTNARELGNIEKFFGRVGDRILFWGNYSVTYEAIR